MTLGAEFKGPTRRITVHDHALGDPPPPASASWASLLAMSFKKGRERARALFFFPPSPTNSCPSCSALARSSPSPSPSARRPWSPLRSRSTRLPPPSRPVTTRGSPGRVGRLLTTSAPCVPLSFSFSCSQADGRPFSAIFPLLPAVVSPLLSLLLFARSLADPHLLSFVQPSRCARPRPSRHYRPRHAGHHCHLESQHPSWCRRHPCRCRQRWRRERIRTFDRPAQVRPFPSWSRLPPSLTFSFSRSPSGDTSCLNGTISISSLGSSASAIASSISARISSVRSAVPRTSSASASASASSASQVRPQINICFSLPPL